MANPQIENGYVKIAGDLFDAIIKIPNLGLGRRQVFDFIIRKTYGWNKKSDAISISQFQQATGLSRRAVIYAIQNLEAMNLIKVTRSEQQENIYQVNKDYDSWTPQVLAPDYLKSIQRRKELYAQGSARNSKVVQEIVQIPENQENLVQEILPSARNCSDLVQEIEKNVKFLAPTKDTIQKTNTKDINILSNESMLARRFLTWFGDLYKTKFGEIYVCPFAKDTKLVKQMLKALGAHELAKRTERFFADEDEFLQNAGYTIGTLKARINSYTDALTNQRELSSQFPGLKTDQALRIKNWAEQGAQIEHN